MFLLFVELFAFILKMKNVKIIFVRQIINILLFQYCWKKNV
jgi:hypothetical protein